MLSFAQWVARSEHPLGALLWTAWIGLLVWLPALTSLAGRYPAVQRLAQYGARASFCCLSSLMAMPFLGYLLPTNANLPRFNTLWGYAFHAFVVWLVVLWAWWEEQAQRRRQSSPRVLLQSADSPSPLILARLAVWLTFSMMPTVIWS